MATFTVDPTSTISSTGSWTPVGDDLHDDLAIGGTGGYTTVEDDESNPAILGGVSLPTDFPSDGADSISYHIQMRVTDTKVSPLPQMKLQITTAGGAEIASVIVSLGATPLVFTDYTGSMTITGNNTLADWTGHRMQLLPISNDTDHTEFEIHAFRATVTYDGGTVYSPGAANLLLGASSNIIQPPMAGYSH